LTGREGWGQGEREEMRGCERNGGRELEEKGEVQLWRERIGTSKTIRCISDLYQAQEDETKDMIHRI
jgi:exopolyphosphatase/pppGpp-phosphohydrolase